MTHFQTISLLALAVFFTVFANPTVTADDFHVAVMHTPSLSARHHDEFDPPLAALGWPSDKFTSETPDMRRLAELLDRYAMVLAAPLFNYETTDLTPFGPAFRKFVENGGALVITDALYPQAFQWLTAVDPTLTLGCEGGCDTQRDPFSTTPPHPLRFLPNILRDGNSWGHLALSESHAWEIVAFCGEGKPATVMKRLGRGFVYVTAFRQPNKETLENLRATLELQRMNLAVTDFQMPELAVGTGTLSVSLRNSSGADAVIRADLRITQEDASAKPLTFSQDIKLPANGENVTAAIPYDLPLRGKLSAVLTLTKDGKTATIFDRRLELPALLTVHPPRYRGFALASTLRCTHCIYPGISVAPYKKDITKMQVRTYAMNIPSADNTAGEILGEVDRRNVESPDFRFPLKVGALPPGKYLLRAELTAGDERLATQTAEFTVLDDTACTAFIDDDMNLLVGGKPFFPIGLYHIPPADLEAHGAELGINFIQLWSWDASGLEIAKKLGIKVLWEQNHRSPTVIAESIPRLKDDPTIVMWYGRDEPYEADFASSLAMHEAFHQADEGRPTFMVTYTPRLFPQHAKLADIMASDVYPFPHQPITQIADFIDQAWAATQGDKPIFAVLQSFGADADPAMRAMTYLALTHEARGILWYPWDDGNNIGLKYHPTSREIVKQLAAEIRTLSPALLTKDGRRPFKSADGKIHGMFCKTPAGERYLLLVNPHAEQNTLTPRDCQELKDTAAMKDAFTKETVPAEHPLIMKAYEARTFTY